MIGKILLGLGVVAGGYLLLRPLPPPARPGTAAGDECARILAAVRLEDRVAIAAKVASVPPDAVARVVADELDARGYSTAANCVRANPAFVGDLTNVVPSDVNPSATYPTPKVSTGSTGPISFLTPRNPPSFDLANPLGAILPSEVFTRVTSILNNYQASGWRGMTVNDFAYLGDVAKDYPTAAPYLEAARQAFVSGYFGGAH